MIESEILSGPEVKPGLMLGWGGHPNGSLVIYGSGINGKGLRGYKGLALFTKDFFNKIRPEKRFDDGWLDFSTPNFLKEWGGAKMLDEEEFCRRKDLIYNTALLPLCIKALLGPNNLYWEHPEFAEMLDSFSNKQTF